MRAKAFAFDSHFNAEIKESEIENGIFSTEDKDFMIENTQPFLLKKSGLFSRFTGESVTPYYFLKWNTLIPASFKIEEKKGMLKDQLDNIKDERLRAKIAKTLEKSPEMGNEQYIYRELVPVDIKFPDAFKYTKKNAEGKKIGEKVVTPEMINSIADMRFLKGFKNYAGDGKTGKKKWMDILFIGGIGAFVVIAMLIGGVLTL